MSSNTREATADASTTTSEAASRGSKVRARASPAARRASRRRVPKRAPGFRVTGLDGVRAVAVLLVILYHLSPGAVIGGYIGVDLFFVVSGFLITTLLLREREATGRISLPGFWRRRARRLLPALGVLVLVCCTAAYAIGKDVLLGLGAQVLGAFTFSSNWLFLVAQSDYFDFTAPELFRNLWSLAVEEQFYLLWPLLLVLVLFRVPRWLRITLIALIAVASAAAMALLWAPESATRVYYGTDTHAFGLAIGAVLAVVAVHWPARPLEWVRWHRNALGIAGTVALAGILAIGMMMPEDAAIVFQGGLVIVALLSAVVIAALLVPGSLLGSILESLPLRWIGQRSYGLYLWHWPVYILVAAALPGWSRAGASGWALGGIAFAITVVAAALSYQFVEQPIRRNGFRATLAQFRASFRSSRHEFVAAVWVVLLAVSTTVGTVGAVTNDPGTGETELLVQAGQEALDAANASSAATPPEPSATPGAPAATDPDAPPQPVGGEQISAIGDSVMLAAAPTLQEKFPGIYIDAAVSRSIYVAPEMLRSLVSAGQLRQVLVLALGTNGPIDRDVLDEIRQIIGPDREMVVVNVQAPRNWTPGVNAELSSFALYYRDVELANWHDAIQPSLNLLAGDQIHFGSAGATIFSATIRDALQRLAELPPLRDDRANQSLPQPV